MTLKFLFSFNQLNLLSFFSKKEVEVIEKLGLIMIKVVKIFEYGKNNDKYYNKAKIHQQTVTNILLIAEALYLGYSLVFLFDNAINYSINTKDILHIGDINKS